MQITYHQNPLHNIVTLNDADKKLLFYKMLNDNIESDLWSLKLNLEDYENGLINIDKAPNHLKPLLTQLTENPVKHANIQISSICDKLLTIKYDETKIQYILVALQQPHDGDCVQNASTCYKCYAEDLLEFSSMPQYPGGIGLDIHLAFKIPETTNQKTLSQAIQHLKDTTPQTGAKDSHFKALEYLVYYQQYLKDQDLMFMSYLQARGFINTAQI